MTTIRIASFNVQNLFSRVRVLSDLDEARAGEVLRQVATLADLLEAPVYDKRAILEVYTRGNLERYINVRCDRVGADGASPRFFFTGSDGRVASINDRIRGRSDWAGGIEFTRETHPALSMEALVRVILQDLQADVLCLCEIEDRRTLRTFNTQWLQGAYPWELLIEGNDDRGIDVALLSKYPIERIRSSTFIPDPAEPLPDGRPGRMFHRDCLDVEVLLPNGERFQMLCNHFKSKGGPGKEALTDPKRIAQATTVAQLLQERYIRDGRWTRHVVVAGDLNESADRRGANGANLGGMATSIDPLLKFAGLSNVLAERLPLEKRWTFDFDGNRQQIDYLLLSSGLNEQVVDCGALYSGRYTDGGNGIASPLHAASDHAAIWVDIRL